MAVVDNKSNAITNRDAGTLNKSHLQGMVEESVGYLAVAADDSANSIKRLCSVPSNGRISQILFSCTDHGTAGTANIGVYENTDKGGAVVDADLFGSAVSLQAVLSNSDVTHESAEFALTEKEMPLWEALGLSEDPHCDYDIAATIVESPENAGTIGLIARFVR